MKIAIKNDNGKLNCKYFLHIATAPAERVSEEKMGGIYTIVNDVTEVNATLVTFIRCKLAEVPMYFIAVSAGTVDKDAWMKQMIDSGKVVAGGEVAVYLYERIGN